MSLHLNTYSRHKIGRAFTNHSWSSYQLNTLNKGITLLTPYGCYLNLGKIVRLLKLITALYSKMLWINYDWMKLESSLINPRIKGREFYLKIIEQQLGRSMLLACKGGDTLSNLSLCLVMYFIVKI